MLPIASLALRLAAQTVPQDGAWMQWLKLLVPAAFLAAIALMWNIVRPGITRLLFYFLRHEDGKLYFEKYFGETMVGMNVELTTAVSAVRTTQRRVEDVAATLVRSDLRISELATGMDRLEDSISRLREAVAKIDGANEERRLYSDTNHPRRRGTDE